MRISTQAKLISTMLVAVAIAAPIAHGETDGTLLSASSPQPRAGEGFSFKAPSYWNAAASYWNARARGETDGTLLSSSYPQLKAGEGFSFEAPTYWKASPSYWSTAPATAAPITARGAVNRSLGVPPQYLGAGTQTDPRTTRVAASSEQVSSASSGFDWLDAGVGAAFVAGLGALGLGAFMAVRRRYGLAHLEV
jgi:hypothetical protein